MHINRLRLLGFKSFVEPTELLVEQGLTGVVGPNGCGKSNLLEALRWVMGETSYKSMRGSVMDDVIFSGTTMRPARNMAEVTIFVDNTERRAPAEFNGSDELEITRRIEREMGSAYRINGREVRARDVKVLFEDAATGARSPALVRQGQIAEIVNAKPEQRRRILEDAAGVAGLHSRRHEAELRLKAAEGNLARINDILGQLATQVESLKRQARQARRYKELSAEIRKGEALLWHLTWVDAKAQVDAGEAELSRELGALAVATGAESAAVLAEAAKSEALPPLREAEAARGAALHRVKIEIETFEREATRTAERQKELEQRSVQLKRDVQRETALVQEARDTLRRLADERADLGQTNGLAVDFERKALAEHDAAEAAFKSAAARLAELTTAVAEARTRRKALDSQKSERSEQVVKLERQLATIETQVREVALRAPDVAKLRAATDTGEALLAEIARTEARMLEIEEQVETCALGAKVKRDAAADANVAAREARTEIETLVKVLAPKLDGEHPPILDEVVVAPGFELAVAAALGDDLDAPASEEAPVHWRLGPTGEADADLPDGVAPLAAHVTAPAELTRRLNQIGLVDVGDGGRLQPLLHAGQRLVSRGGDLWRWDGFVAAGHASTAAAARLAERNRLGALIAKEAELRREAETAAETERQASEAHRAAESAERQLRQDWREAQARLAEIRDTLMTMERQARETEAKLAAATEARDRAGDALVELNEKLAETEAAIAALGDIAPLEAELKTVQERSNAERGRVARAQAALATLEREHRMRSDRLKAIAIECERWTARSLGAEQQITALEDRGKETETELAELAALPALIEEGRIRLMDQVAAAESARTAAADALAAADTAHREAAQALRQAQATVATAREARARSEARLEGARSRRGEVSGKIVEALGCSPEEVLRLIESSAAQAAPQLVEVERNLTRLKADRERLGGVNLQADDELAKMSEQFESLQTEKLDVEDAIAKLRGGIGQLNREAKARLEAAFTTVNGHFQRLFTTLFGGGEARLEIIESEEDPLEGGLEIIAKPPGKKPAVLSLLSGGEQALTALSLIFAVFLTNPSPICVLDEVDAPLDDANVDRFCLMMEKMAAETATRFLVITHHPMTMARMNRLFGVTMGEKGVSQLVSVDLETAQRFAGSEAA